MPEPGGRASTPPLAWALLALPICFWGGGYSATAIATEHTSGLMLAALRTLPSLALLPLVFLFGVRLPGRQDILGAVVSGLLVVTVFVIGISVATRHIGAANTAVLGSAAPLWVAVLARIFLRERISRTAAVGLCIGFAGIVVMVSHRLGGSHGAGDLSLGIALGLSAGIAWAMGTLIVRRLALRNPGLDFVGLTAAQYLAGSPLLIIAAFTFKGTHGTDWGSLDLWGATLWLSLGSSGIAALAFFMSLRWLKAAQTSSAQFLVPVVAVVIEFVRGHAPGGLTLVGMAVAICGVGLVVVGEPVRLALVQRLRPA